MRMSLSKHEIEKGFRDGSLYFCMPMAHDEFTDQFLNDFSERILKRDWREVCAFSRVPSVLVDNADEEDFVVAIEAAYGVDVSDLPGLPLWDVVRRCARSV